ncbi:MAG: magnesium transporter, partial [Actinomycetota bacterium]|nr:magnesium transporter [Actinomycetota bacterium]
MDDEFEGFLETVTPLLRDRRLDELRELLAEQDAADIAQLLEREDARDRAVLYRLLRRDQALEAFELLDPGMRAELIGGLREDDVAKV